MDTLNWTQNLQAHLISETHYEDTLYLTHLYYPGTLYLAHINLWTTHLDTHHWHAVQHAGHFGCPRGCTLPCLQGTAPVRRVYTRESLGCDSLGLLPQFTVGWI